MPQRLRILTLIFLIATVTLLNAETFNFRHYKAEDGLSLNTVSSIIQDKKGFIWIGTEDGLNRFDGYRFKIYKNFEHKDSVRWSGYVSSLLEVQNGDIWIGTDAGVCIYNPKNEKITRFSYKSDNTEITSSINNITQDKAGCIWISTYGQGIFQFNPKTKKLEQYRIIIDGASTKVYDFINHIFVDNSNQVWAGPKTPNNPLITFDRKANCFRVYNIKEQNELSVYKIFEDSDKNLWLGTWDQGICKLDKENKCVTKFLTPNKPGGILHVHEINEYRPGVLMVGSDDGLSLFDTRTGTHKLFTSSEIDPYSISDKFVYPILKDREGGIWVGTYYGGVNYVSPNSGIFERYIHSRYTNSVNGNVIGGFTEDKNGNIWIASDDGGLNVLNPKTGKFNVYMPSSNKNSISYHNVHALCWDDDKLWIGTYAGGLNVLDIKTGRFHVYNSETTNIKTLDGGSIYAIFKDRNSRMWVGTMSGINLYNRETNDFTRIKQFNATTIDILQDHKGWIWFATLGKGAYRFNPQTNKWKNYNTSNGLKNALPSNQLSSILLDNKQNLWFGTSNGLCRYNYDNDNFETFNLNIPSSTILGIVDDNENLWLTTTKGLVRFNTRNSKIQVFTQSDGLISDQFLVNSIFKSSSGKIYIGTASGFNAFYPQKVNTNKNIPTVAITDFEIFNQSISIDPDGPLKESLNFTEKISLSYKQNVFTITFAALSYSTPQKNKYAYKLEGFDKDWNYVNNQHQATYTNLPAGKYEFHVKASNSDGLWNDKGTRIDIIIHPPIWLSTGFKIIYLLLAVSLILYLFRYYKQRTEQRHHKKIKELNQEKEKEVYDAKIQFFTMIAHEIRTPVSLIIGPLEKITSSGFRFPESLRSDLNVIERNSQRLLHLVNQLLDFRKAEQGAMVMCFSRQNIYQLLCNISDRFKPMMERKMIGFTLDCPDKNFEAIVDQEAFTKIISNLLTNATKFTKNQIHLSCNLHFSLDNFEIRVLDNGCGISDEEKSKVFNPFYQTPDGKKQGTGIGLSLVKSLVEAHAGSVSITDAYPVGVIFTITLPIHNQITNCDHNSSIDVLAHVPEKIETVFEQVTVADKHSNNSPFVLIVEDDADMCSFLVDSFSSEYNVLVAENGIEGLKQLNSHEVNLIISDLMMPLMDGMEFCKIVRENILWSHIPFVMLTAKTDLDSKIDSINLGADSYVEKPFSISFLKAQIYNLIETRKLLRKKYSEMPFVSITTIAGNSADEQFLSKVNEIINTNISNEDFSIDQLAEQLFISRSGLFAKIKTLAGITPNDLIQLIRLKKAAEYLVKNEHRVNEVAYMVGFNNPSYFSKCFQKQFGLRPMDFAKKNQKSSS